MDHHWQMNKCGSMWQPSTEAEVVVVSSPVSQVQSQESSRNQVIWDAVTFFDLCYVCVFTELQFWSLYAHVWIVTRRFELFFMRFIFRLRIDCCFCGDMEVRSSENWYSLSRRIVCSLMEGLFLFKSTCSSAYNCMWHWRLGVLRLYSVQWTMFEILHERL